MMLNSNYSTDFKREKLYVFILFIRWNNQKVLADNKAAEYQNSCENGAYPAPYHTQGNHYG